MSDQEQTILNALLELQKSVSSIDKNLAVNTVETKNISEHLKTLNGKVASHESRLQNIEGVQSLTSQTVANMQKQEDTSSGVWRRWSDKLLWGVVVVVSLLFYKLLVKVEIIKDFLS